MSNQRPIKVMPEYDPGMAGKSQAFSVVLKGVIELKWDMSHAPEPETHGQWRNTAPISGWFVDRKKRLLVHATEPRFIEYRFVYEENAQDFYSMDRERDPYGSWQHPVKIDEGWLVVHRTFVYAEDVEGGPMFTNEMPLWVPYDADASDMSPATIEKLCKDHKHFSQWGRNWWYMSLVATFSIDGVKIADHAEDFIQDTSDKAVFQRIEVESINALHEYNKRYIKRFEHIVETMMYMDKVYRPMPIPEEAPPTFG